MNEFKMSINSINQLLPIFPTFVHQSGCNSVHKVSIMLMNKYKFCHNHCRKGILSDLNKILPLLSHLSSDLDEVWYIRP